MVKVELDRDATKTLSRLPFNVGDLIETKIEQLARDPDSLRNNVTRLSGTENSRLRIGDWRVIFRVDGDTLRILRIASRGSIYE